MSINKKFSNLQKALDTKQMGLFFQKELLKYWGTETKLKNLWVEQIYPLENECRIKYRLNFKNSNDTSHSSFLIYGQLFQNQPEESLLDQLRQNGEDFIYQPSVKMLVQVFPFDRKLETLTKAFSAEYMLKFFNEKLPQELRNGREIIGCRIGVLGYRLEKRCTLLYELSLKAKKDSLKLIGKIYSEKKSEELFKRLAKIKKANFFKDKVYYKIPSLILFSPELKALFFEYSQGESLSKMKNSNSYFKVIARIPRLLELLQKSRIKLEKKHTLKDELKIVDRSYRILNFYLPEENPKIHLIYQKIKKGSNLLENKVLRPSHRDFYDKQILTNGKKLTIIDWDTFCLSDPALDFGNFAAHLKLKSLQNSIPSIFLNKAEKLFEEKTSNLVKLEEIFQNYKFYKVTALFRLASIYAYKPLWKNLGTQLLEICEKEGLS